MQHGEYSEFSSGCGVCSCCGADINNQHKHHEGCISNLPGRFNDLYPIWEDGFDAANEGKGLAPPDMAENDAAHIAYMMGIAIARHRVSLKQATAGAQQTAAHT